MSFILDALRKSENERQRNQTPGMANMQTQNRRKGSGIWVPLVALLIGINLSLIVVMWFLSDDKQPAVNPTPVSSDAGAISQPPAARRLAEELSPEQPVRSVTPAETSGVNTAVLPATPPPGYSGDADENIPTLAELMLQNAISLPQLHLDIHVYSDTPSERFVFINMSRYNEGGSLSEGPKVVRISKIGVVLRHQGQEFMMVREQ
jgi:general secretion pathway protein B